MVKEGQLLKDRNDKSTILSSTNTQIEFDTNAKRHIFSFKGISGTITDFLFSITHSIDNGETFNTIDNGESILLDENECTLIIEDLLTDVMRINYISGTTNPEFEIYYRAVRDGRN